MLRVLAAHQALLAVGLRVLVHIPGGTRRAARAAGTVYETEGDRAQELVQQGQEGPAQRSHCRAGYMLANEEEWASLSRIVFKDREEEDVIDQFTTVVKNHYVQVKKSQSDKYALGEAESTAPSF